MSQRSYQRAMGGTTVHIGDCYVWASIYYLDSSTDYREYIQAVRPQPSEMCFQSASMIGDDHPRGFPSWRLLNRLLLFVGIMILLALGRGFSQTDVDQVHVTPRTNAAVRPDRTADSSLSPS